MKVLLTMECSCEEAVHWARGVLVLSQLQVLSSFDLRLARQAHATYICPHHGTAVCDCQMVILLVYGGDARPATVMVRGCDGMTTLSLADGPTERPSPELETAINHALAVESPTTSI